MEVKGFGIYMKRNLGSCIGLKGTITLVSHGDVYPFSNLEKKKEQNSSFVEGVSREFEIYRIVGFRKPDAVVKERFEKFTGKPDCEGCVMGYIEEGTFNHLHDYYVEGSFAELKLWFETEVTRYRKAAEEVIADYEYRLNKEIANLTFEKVLGEIISEKVGDISEKIGENLK